MTAAGSHCLDDATAGYPSPLPCPRRGTSHTDSGPTQRRSAGRSASVTPHQPGALDRGVDVLARTDAVPGEGHGPDDADSVQSIERT